MFSRLSLDLLHPEAYIQLPNQQGNAYPPGLEQSIWLMCGTKNVIIRQFHPENDYQIHTSRGLDLISGEAFGFVYVFSGFYTVNSTTYIVVNIDAYDNYFPKQHIARMLKQVSPTHVGMFLAHRYPRNDTGLSVCIHVRNEWKEFHFGKGFYLIMNPSTSSIISRMRAKSFSNVIRGMWSTYAFQVDVVESSRFMSLKKCEVCMEVTRCCSLCGFFPNIDLKDEIDGHWCCGPCAKRWLEINKTCPHCRNVLHSTVDYTFQGETSYADLLIALLLYERYGLDVHQYTTEFQTILNDYAVTYFNSSFGEVCRNMSNTRERDSDDDYFDFCYSEMGTELRKFELNLVWYWFKIVMFDEDMMRLFLNYHNQYFIRQHAHLALEVNQHLLTHPFELRTYIDPRKGIIDYMMGEVSVAIYESFEDGKIYAFRSKHNLGGFASIQAIVTSSNVIAIPSMAAITEYALSLNVVNTVNNIYINHLTLGSLTDSPLDFRSMHVVVHYYGDDQVVVPVPPVQDDVLVQEDNVMPVLEVAQPEMDEDDFEQEEED